MRMRCRFLIKYLSLGVFGVAIAGSAQMAFAAGWVVQEPGVQTQSSPWTVADYASARSVTPMVSTPLPSSAFNYNAAVQAGAQAQKQIGGLPGLGGANPTGLRQVFSYYTPPYVGAYENGVAP